MTARSVRCAAAALAGFVVAAYPLAATAAIPPDPVYCGVLKMLGVPADINAGTDIHGWSMDPDDCDMYFDEDRIIDFVPYDD